MKEPPEPGSRFRDFFDHEVWEIPVSIFDRLMRLKDRDFSEGDFLDLYCELEAGYLWDRLPIVIVVPIVLTHFDAANFQLSGTTGIIELSEEVQLARMPSRDSPTMSANEVVLGAATHAFILANYEMANPTGDPYPEHDNLGWYPTVPIDQFFDALRVVTGLDTGYAQLFLMPRQGWANSFSRDLPSILCGPAVRRYPDHFDDFGWLEKREPVTTDQLSEVGEVLAALDQGGQSLQLAASRLSAAMLREKEDDKILDLLIGLEAALGDKSKTEMTFKLALRTAAILAGVAPEEAGVIFGNVKKLYAYRSAVAHGDRKRADQRRTIELDGELVAVSDIAIRYLRNVIRELGQRPDIEQAGDIDAKLILRALTDARMGGGPLDKEAS